MSINAKPKDQEAAVIFPTDYCRAGGQKFPLSGGANAVPALIQLPKV
jgi:hypothetical protein